MLRVDGPDGRSAGRRSPRKTVQRLEALVNGMPSGIVNVSAEGLRLEVPRERRARCRRIRRARPAHGRGGDREAHVDVAVEAARPRPLRCGAVAQSPSSEERWRAFVDTIPMSGDGSLRVSA